MLLLLGVAAAAGAIAVSQGAAAVLWHVDWPAIGPANVPQVRALKGGGVVASTFYKEKVTLGEQSVLPVDAGAGLNWACDLFVVIDGGGDLTSALRGVNIEAHSLCPTGPGEFTLVAENANSLLEVMANGDMVRAASHPGMLLADYANRRLDNVRCISTTLRWPLSRGEVAQRTLKVINIGTEMVQHTVYPTSGNVTLMSPGPGTYPIASGDVLDLKYEAHGEFPLGSGCPFGLSLGFDYPDFEITPAELDFGAMRPGESDQTSFRVHNTSDHPIELEFRVDDSVTVPSGVELAPDEAVHVPVTASPQRPMWWGTSISVRYRDTEVGAIPVHLWAYADREGPPGQQGTEREARPSGSLKAVRASGGSDTYVALPGTLSSIGDWTFVHEGAILPVVAVIDGNDEVRAVHAVGWGLDGLGGPVICDLAIAPDGEAIVVAEDLNWQTGELRLIIERIDVSGHLRWRVQGTGEGLYLSSVHALADEDGVLLGVSGAGTMNIDGESIDLSTAQVLQLEPSGTTVRIKQIAVKDGSSPVPVEAPNDRIAVYYDRLMHQTADWETYRAVIESVEDRLVLAESHPVVRGPGGVIVWDAHGNGEQEYFSGVGVGKLGFRGNVDWGFFNWRDFVARVDWRGALRVSVLQDLPVSPTSRVDEVETLGCFPSPDDGGCSQYESYMLPVGEDGLAVLDATQLFSADRKELSDVQELALLSGGVVVGKVGCSYTDEEFQRGRQKEVRARLHDELMPYGARPVAEGSDQWVYPRYYRYRSDHPLDAGTIGLPINPVTVFPASLLVPPFNTDGDRLFSNTMSNRRTILLVHGIYGTEGDYWGRSGIDFWRKSYPGQLQFQNGLETNIQCWEVCYPPDAAPHEAGYLIGEEIDDMSVTYGTHPDGIVAHSMGTIATLSYVKGLAHAITALGDVVYAPVIEGIGKIALLGGPCNGSFGANRAYHGIMLPSRVYFLLAGMDPNSPGVREMRIGDSELVELNRAPYLHQCLVVAGTTWQGTIPGLGDSRFGVESREHDDGIVSGSSSGLRRLFDLQDLQTAFIEGFSHESLRWPDDPDSIVTGEGRKLLPDLLRAFLGGQTLDREIWRARGVHVIGAPEVWEDGLVAGSWSTDLGPYHYDVTLPIVTFKERESTARWVPRDRGVGRGLRFRMTFDSRGSGTVHLTQEEISVGSYALCDAYCDGGMFLYFNANNAEEGKQAEWTRSPAFFGYECKGGTSSNVMSQFGTPGTPLPVEGSGWHLPPVPGRESGSASYGVIVGRRDVGNELGFTVNARGSIDLGWCNTRYSTIEIDRAVLAALDAEDIVTGNFLDEKTTDGVWVDVGVTTATFVVSGVTEGWPGALVAPSGSRYRPGIPGTSGIRMSWDIQTGYWFLTTDTPEQGLWTLDQGDRRSKAAGVTSLVCFRDVEAPLRLSITDSEGVVSAKAWIQAGTDHVTLSSMTGSVCDGEAVTIPLAFRDDGISPDETSGDGVYSAVVEGPGLGDVFITAAAWGTRNGATFSRGSRIAYDMRRQGLTAILIEAFTAESTMEGVRIEWTVPSGVGDLAYLLYRRTIEPTETPDELVTSDPLFSDGHRTFSFLDAGAPEGSVVEYRLAALAPDGDREMFGPIRVRVERRTGTDIDLRLLGPNPSPGFLMVGWSAEKGQRTTIRIVDVTGRLVREWRDITSPGAGREELRWDGTNHSGRQVSSGTYFLILEGEEASEARKFTLVR